MTTLSLTSTRAPSRDGAVIETWSDVTAVSSCTITTLSQPDALIARATTPACTWNVGAIVNIHWPPSPCVREASACQGPMQTVFDSAQATRSFSVSPDETVEMIAS